MSSAAAQAAPDLARDGAVVLAWLQIALSLLFVVALPLLIIGTNLRLLVGDRELMLTGFRRDRVDAVTGLDQASLERVADAFVRYLGQDPPGRMDVQVEIQGQRRPLFNERELLHMEDVQALIHQFFRLQVIAAVIVAARVLWALGVERSARSLGRDMLLSTALVVALVVVIGLLSAVDFSALWTRFHQVAFRNDLWQLDPRTDYLIMLFPQPAWFTYTLRMVGGTAGMTLIAGVAGFLAWRYSP